MPYVASIHIYPVKSLDGIAVDRAMILPSGALEGDRSFAIFDDLGQFVNGKRNSGVHFLRFWFDPENRTVSLKIQGTEEEFFFHIDTERSEIESWLSNYFGFHVKLVENLLVGFPDDTASPGPTAIGTETIAEVASWFPRVSVSEMRQRLRANIEIGGVPPFWEDQLFGEADEIVRFKIGTAIFEGINPCQRCIVPARHPQTKETYPSFQKIFTAKRKETMPEWVKKSRFNHFYRLSVNTRVLPQSAGTIVTVGDRVEILSISKAKV
ncbi:MAG: MOSC domain-containing protein [Richelia sp. CSU_2_1]|nr:MOSC domain-containing protein [Richelia sp. CSU_2_1]